MVPGPRRGGEEQPFAAEHGGLDLAHVLDVVVDRRLQADQAAGVDAKQFARREVTLEQSAARMHEGEPVALELLHDEAFAAEEAGAEFALERDAERDAARGAEERILLAQERAAKRGEIERHDLARIGRGKGDAPLAGRYVGVDRGEQ